MEATSCKTDATDSFLDHLDNVLQSVNSQLDMLKDHILEQRNMVTKAVLADFHVILDLTLEQIQESSRFSRNCSVSIKQCCESLVNFVTNEGEETVKHVANECGKLTDFVISEKDKIIDFLEKECTVIMDSIQDLPLNMFSCNLSILQEKCSHVFKCVFSKCELTMEFLEAEWKELDKMVFSQFEESLKVVQEECSLLNTL